MSNTTTRCAAYQITRTDGAILGFSDHDENFTLDGLTYHAASALTPTEAVAAVGLAADNQDIAGALQSDVISDTDLAAGLYDGARVTVRGFDWAAGAALDVIGIYNLGQVARTQNAFTAELRSIAGLLAQKRGRFVTGQCDAELADARCKVSIAARQKSGALETINGPTDFIVSGLTGDIETEFAGGVITWTSGPNIHLRAFISYHRDAALGLWSPPPHPATPGDTFAALPGCDKSFETCRNVFANGDNFRGFPTITGAVAGNYSLPGEAGLDGGSYYKF